MPYCKYDQHSKYGRGIEDPETPFVTLEICQPIVAIVWYLDGAIQGAKGDEDR